MRCPECGCRMRPIRAFKVGKVESELGGTIPVMDWVMLCDRCGKVTSLRGEG